MAKDDLGERVDNAKKKVEERNDTRTRKKANRWTIEESRKQEKEEQPSIDEQKIFKKKKEKRKKKDTR